MQLPQTDDNAQSIGDVLAEYPIGDILEVTRLTKGTVQENYLVSSSSGKFVFRKYLSRSVESVRFEVDLLTDLAKQDFPCAPPLMNRSGSGISTWEGRPAALFVFAEGEERALLSGPQRRSVIAAVARLHTHTMGNQRFLSPHRWNYSIGFCATRLEEAAARSGRPDAAVRQDWLLDRLGECEIPDGLPRGVCHCDFASSNLLFRGERLSALLDFDDANYTWLAYDLVNLMDFWFCKDDGTLDWDLGAEMLADYSRQRLLTRTEREHLFDVHRFQIILDAVWFFDRGTAADFRERRRIEYLDSLGRREYVRRLGL